MTDLMNHNSLVHIRKTEMSAVYESHKPGDNTAIEYNANKYFPLAKLL